MCTLYKLSQSHKKTAARSTKCQRSTDLEINSKSFAARVRKLHNISWEQEVDLSIPNEPEGPLQNGWVFRAKMLNSTLNRMDSI